MVALRMVGTEPWFDLLQLTAKATSKPDSAARPIHRAPRGGRRATLRWAHTSASWSVRWREPRALQSISSIAGSPLSVDLPCAMMKRRPSRRRLLRHSWLRSASSFRIALPALVALLGVAGYLVTSETIGRD